MSCLLFKSSIGSCCVMKIFNESLLKSLLIVNASNRLRGNSEVSHIHLASLQRTAFSLGLRIRSNHLSVSCDKSRWHLLHPSPPKTTEEDKEVLQEVAASGSLIWAGWYIHFKRRTRYKCFRLYSWPQVAFDFLIYLNCDGSDGKINVIGIFFFFFLNRTNKKHRYFSVIHFYF